MPISFVSEHIETLEEIDMEYRELAHESGIKQVGEAFEFKFEFVRQGRTSALKELTRL